MIRILSARISIVLLVVTACSRSHEAPPPPPAPTPTPPHLAPPPDAAAVPDAPIALAPPLTTRGHIAAGFGYGCVHTVGDKLTCWGRTYPDTPTQLYAMKDVAGVVTAQATTCAWTKGGEVFCSGGGPLVLVDGVSDVVQVATDADAFVMCARRKSGTVACWSDFDKPAPRLDTPGITGALEIAVAGTTACLRDASGVGCWKTNDPAPKLKRIPAAAGATSISGGHFTFVALRAGKPPVAWAEDGYKPYPLPALPADVTQIALASETGCALGRTVQCWTLKDLKSLHEIPQLAGALEIAVGYSIACARVDHRVGCWGSAGSLGDGPVTTDTPVSVANLDDATNIAILTNIEATCARRANGRVVCWGADDKGVSRPAPVDVGTDAKSYDLSLSPRRSWSGSNGRGSWTCTKAKHVTCEETFFGRDQETDTGPETTWGNLDGARDLRMPTNLSDQVCVASATGAVTCFGAFDGADHAETIDGVTDAIQLVDYSEDTCALERAGTVKCWGTGTKSAVRTIANITDAVELAGGDLHACVRHKTGKVSCWGSRSQLGDNTDIHGSTPLWIPGVTTP